MCKFDEWLDAKQVDRASINYHFGYSRLEEQYALEAAEERAEELSRLFYGED